MARRSSHHSLGMGLSKAETIAGWCYLPFYLVFLSVIIQKIAEWLQIPLTDYGLNLTYFCLNLMFILVIFHRFLRQKFFGAGFWNFVQALILGFVMHYVGTWLIQEGVELLFGTFTVFNNETVEGLITSNEIAMMIITIVLAPIIEETLIRGLVFGSLHSTSRILAYFMSAFIFVLMHNWQYFGLHSVGDVLLSCLPYIPSAIALGWTYEKAGTIWAPIAMHAAINAMSYGLFQLS